MFENFRQSLRDLMDRSTTPEARRAGLAQMKQTLVQARMGLDDLRGGIEQTRQRLAAEQRELDTVRRRKGLAAGINDLETVQLAEKYEVLHAERVARPPYTGVATTHGFLVDRDLAGARTTRLDRAARKRDSLA